MITREINFYLTPTFNKYPLYIWDELSPIQFVNALTSADVRKKVDSFMTDNLCDDAIKQCFA